MFVVIVAISTTINAESSENKSGNPSRRRPNTLFPIDTNRTASNSNIRYYDPALGPYRNRNKGANASGLRPEFKPRPTTMKNTSKTSAKTQQKINTTAT